MLEHACERSVHEQEASRGLSAHGGRLCPGSSASRGGTNGLEAAVEEEPSVDHPCMLHVCLWLDACGSWGSQGLLHQCTTWC